MPESQDTAADIQKIRYHVEAVEDAQMLLLQLNGEQLLDKFEKFFRSEAFFPETYLEIDGVRNQADILRSMTSAGIRISQPVLSRRMTALKSALLIEAVGSKAGGPVYAQNPVVEKALRLSKHVEKWKQQPKR